MLTADLVQARVGKTHVRPRYVDSSDRELLDLAATLIAIYVASVERTRAELRAELDEHLGTGTEFQLHRGLAKLLEDRCDFETRARIDPVDLRRAVFEAAAKERLRSGGIGFDRRAVLDGVARALETSVEEIDRGLFGDLKDEQVLCAFDRPSPSWLLDRYNVALAQAVLLRATRVDVEIAGQSPARLRELFRRLKFLRLLFEIEPLGGERFRLRLDGPLSLFRSSQRYGLQLAVFLPVLLHAEVWTLEAEVLWGKARQRKRFELASEEGLRPYTFSRGQWQPEELGWLVEQFEKLASDWTIAPAAEAIDLGRQGVLIPDYAFTHRPSGRRVLFEILGYWRRGAVESRLATVRESGPANLILGVSKELSVEEDALEGLPSPVYLFRSTPIARELLQVLQQFEAKA